MLILPRWRLYGRFIEIKLAKPQLRIDELQVQVIRGHEAKLALAQTKPDKLLQHSNKYSAG